MGAVETITIGSDTFSVYGLGNADPVADADSYLAAKIGSTWSTATTLQKQQSLISAARLIDRAVNFSGTKTVATQPRAWPRDGADCDGTAVTDGTVPDDIANAQFELADLLFLDSSLLDASGTGSNIKRVKAGSAEVENFAPTNDPNFETRLPQPVHDIIGCYVESPAGLNSTSYGTTDADGVSSFDCETFDRTEGYP